MLALAGWVFARALSADPRAMSSLSLLLDLTPLEVHELLRRHLARFSGVEVAPLALAGSLWLGSSAFHTLMSVFEQGSPASRKRSWLQKRLLAMACVLFSIAGFAIGTSVALYLAGGPVSFLRSLVTGVDLGPELGHGLVLLALLTTLTALLAGFFRIAVRRPGVARVIWPGALVTVVIGALSSLAFARYAAELARFSLFYGGLAAVAVTMIWLYVLCGALLLGAELNVELETDKTERRSAAKSKSA
jgi:membrane protein